MKTEFKHVLFSSAAVMLFVSGSAQQASAQDNVRSVSGSYTTAQIEEIIVTANKREEKLNSVGLTVSAISGQALVERRITTLENLASVVPGFSVAPSSSVTPILTLRGVGFDSAALGSYPAVSAYVDQFPLPFPVLALHPAYDLERVEVLKGPQGTLFGQNSTGGAINFIAAKPTSNLQAGGDISYGRFNDVQGNVYVSGPISQNLRGRIAGSFQNRDGWQISSSRPYDRNGAVSFGAGRLILDWDPSERIRFSLNVNGWIDKSEPQAPQFIGLYPLIPAAITPQELSAPFSPQKPRAADWSTGENTPRGDRKFYQIGLRSDFDLTDDITVTSLTSYDHFKETQAQEFDGLPIIVNAYAEQGYIHSFGQELRLANATSAALRWTVGGNYERTRTYDIVISNFPDGSQAHNPFGPFSNGFGSTYQRIRNIAAFGNLEYDLTAQLKAKAGVRYTNLHNTSSLCTGDGGSGELNALYAFFETILGFTPLPTPPGSCTTFNVQGEPDTSPTRLKLNEDNISWRAGLDYKVNEGTLIYANVSRGFKAGSYPLFQVTDVRQYAPVTQESVTSYELGIKTDLFNRVAHLNAAAFYYNYHDKQVFGRVFLPGVLVGTPYQTALVNVPKSRVFGLEGDMTVRPTPELTLTGSVTYLDTRILEYSGFDVVGNGNSGTPRDLSGNRLPYAPKFSYNLDVEYRWKLADGGSPFAGISMSGRTSQDTTIAGSSLIIPSSILNSRINPRIAHPYKLDGYALLDLRLGYSAPDGAWRVMAYGKNVLNKYYVMNTITAESIARFAGMPATYGITFGFKFN